MLLLPLINVAFPANALIVFKILNMIFNFKFFDLVEFNNKLFDFDTSEPLSDNFDSYDIF